MTEVLDECSDESLYGGIDSADGAGDSATGLGEPTRVHVAMMCGCPSTPGGIWDANAYEVRALVKQNGKQVGEVPLKYAGQASKFEGEVPTPLGGKYEVTVYAYDAANGNTGVDKVSFTVAGAAGQQ